MRTKSRESHAQDFYSLIKKYDEICIVVPHIVLLYAEQQKTECRYHCSTYRSYMIVNKAFIIDKKYAANLLQKKNTFVQVTRTKKQIFIAMISANGIAKNLYADDLISNVVTLDELFG